MATLSFPIFKILFSNSVKAGTGNSPAFTQLIGQFASVFMQNFLPIATENQQTSQMNKIDISMTLHLCVNQFL